MMIYKGQKVRVRRKSSFDMTRNAMLKYTQPKFRGMSVDSMAFDDTWDNTKAQSIDICLRHGTYKAIGYRLSF